MGQYVTRVRTENGDMQIDYNALANKPVSLPANGGNSDTVGGKHAYDFASASDVEKLEENLNKVLNEELNEVSTKLEQASTKLDETAVKLSSVETKLGEVSTEEFAYVAGVTENIQTQLDGKAPSVHKHSASDITSGALPISRGGIGAENGADGLKNLFAAGNTILSSYQYGNELPEAGTVGRLFLKKVIK